MRGIIFDLLLIIDDTANLVIFWASAVTGIISLLKEIFIWESDGKGKSSKRQTSKKGVWASIFIISLLICVVAFTRSKLTRVPDVIGKPIMMQPIFSVTII